MLPRVLTYATTLKDFESKRQIGGCGVNATEVDKEFDLFISYAKEDEPHARRLANLFHDQAGLRIYFALRQLPTNESNPQALLISALKRSHGILLLWSQWIDKSEWVALEAAIFATDRSIQKDKHQTHLAVLDLGGPLLPPWLPHDLILQPALPEDLVKIFETPEWWKNSMRQQPSTSPVSLASEVLFRLPKWNTRVRAVLPRVGPKFSISHLRATDLRTVAVARLIRDALAASIFWILIIAGLSLALWAWVLHFPYDSQGYVPRGIQLAAGTAFSATVFFSFRIGVAAGLGAGIIGSICGCTTAIVAAYFCRRPDPWAAAVAAGSALGAAAAIAMRTHELSGHQESTFRLADWRPLVGIAATPELSINMGGIIVPCAAGLHCGSCYTGDSTLG